MITERCSNVRRVIREQQLDAVLLYATKDDFRTSQWLLGVPCRGVFHYLLVTETKTIFLEMSYLVPSAVLPAEVEVIGFPEEDELGDTLRDVLRGIKRLGLCGPVPWSHLSWYQGEIVDVTPSIYSLMVAKSPEEIRKIRENGTVLRESICSVGELFRDKIRNGVEVRETEIEKRLRSVLFEYCDTLAFPISTAVGPVLMHGTLGKASERRVGRDEAICIDAGLVKGGFYADCTRMFFPEHSDLEESYLILEECLSEFIPSLMPGMSFKAVGDDLQELLRRRGLDADTLVLPDLGHGIGYSLHEPPFFSKPLYDNWMLQSGMVITLEPEITMYGRCIRIEDMVVIGEEGGQRIT